MIRKRLLVVTVILMIVLTLSIGIPALAAQVPFANIAGTYTVSLRLPVYELNNTYMGRATTATLTITDNTTTSRGVIGTANINVTGYGTVALVGFVGAGTANPRISLIGSDGETVVNLNGRVYMRRGTLRFISGSIDGWRWHGGGSLGHATNATAAWSTAASYNGSISALLTQGANAGSTYVQIDPPDNNAFHIHDLGSIVSGWSIAHNLELDKSNGPQVELRFAASTNVNPDGAGHVDVTVLPYQQAGTGAWVVSPITSATNCIAYGNDPWDGTAFSVDSPIALSAMEAAINATAEMQANSSSASAWTLTRIRVEIWEAGARTCYVDDITINDVVESFEPVQFNGSFKATRN